MDQEVADARARLAARYGTPTQIGGKGKSAHSPSHVIEGHALFALIRYSKKNQEGRHYSNCW